MSDPVPRITGSTQALLLAHSLKELRSSFGSYYALEALVSVPPGADDDDATCARIGRKDLTALLALLNDSISTKIDFMIQVSTDLDMKLRS